MAMPMTTIRMRISREFIEATNIAEAMQSKVQVLF